MSTVHVARFGNVGGGHALIAHSGIPPEARSTLQWTTDLPGGPHEVWEPFWAGFPLGEGYAVRYTRPDTDADRAGMVDTVVGIADADIFQVPIGPLLDLVASDPPMQPCVVDVRASPIGSDAAGLPALIDALADSRRAVWLGHEGYREAIEALWNVLAPEDRRRVVFGLAWHPEAVSYPLSTSSLPVFLTPRHLRQRFEDWPAVDVENLPRPGPLASAVLGIGGGDVAGTANRLGIAQPTLLQWSRAAAASPLIDALDDLAGEDLRGLAHLLAVLAPDPDHGVAIKDRVVARVSETAPSGDLSDVRALRTFPAEMYPSPPNTREILRRWAADVFENRRTGTLAQALEEPGGDDWWAVLSSTVEETARSELEATVQFLTEMAHDGRRSAFAALADKVGAEHAIDERVADTLVNCGIGWVPEDASQRGWAATHAATCDTAEPIRGWREHVEVATRSDASYRRLQQRVGAAATVAAALTLDDEMLTSMAGQLVANAPALLAPAQVGHRRWRAVWAASIHMGADPWAAVSPEEAVSVLVDVATDGGDVDGALWDAAAGSRATDLSEHPRRAQAWPVIPDSVRDAFLERTARSLALSLPNERDDIEEPVVTAMLRPRTLAAVAQVDGAPAVDVLRRHEDRVKPEMVEAVIGAVHLDLDSASAVGQLIARRRFTRLAKDVAYLAESRGDLMPAANACAGLLGPLERIRIRFLGGADISGELHEGLHQVSVDLYPHGPSDRAVWGRAGGNPADLPDGMSGRERWRRGLDLVLARASGAPTLEDMLEAMVDDFPQNPDLQRLREII